MEGFGSPASRDILCSPAAFVHAAACRQGTRQRWAMLPCEAQQTAPGGMGIPAKCRENNEPRCDPPCDTWCMRCPIRLPHTNWRAAGTCTPCNLHLKEDVLKECHDQALHTGEAGIQPERTALSLPSSVLSLALQQCTQTGLAQAASYLVFWLLHFKFMQPWPIAYVIAYPLCFVRCDFPFWHSRRPASNEKKLLPSHTSELY